MAINVVPRVLAQEHNTVELKQRRRYDLHSYLVENEHGPEWIQGALAVRWRDGVPHLIWRRTGKQVAPFGSIKFPNALCIRSARKVRKDDQIIRYRVNVPISYVVWALHGCPKDKTWRYKQGDIRNLFDPRNLMDI